MMINYREINEGIIEEVKEIYKKGSWNAYLKDDEKLIRAFENSLYSLGAFDNDKLIGFIRCVGDGEHVLIVQDLIVNPDFQQKGIGTYLFKTIMERYAEVRMFMVYTDIDDVIDNKFYKSFDLKTLEDKRIIGYIR